MPKRTLEYVNIEISKKQRLTNNYHPASGVHNYMLNDPVLDWIKYRKGKLGEVHEVQEMEDEVVPEESKRFSEFITQKGKEFEHQVIEILQDKFEN